MHLNTIAGRTYNDLSQYPVVSICCCLQFYVCSIYAYNTSCCACVW